MTKKVRKPTSFRFSTNESPEKDQAPFVQTAALSSFPGLSMISGGGEGYRASRSRKLIAESSGDLFLQLHLGGSGHITQLGRDIILGPGEAVLLSSSDVLATEMREPVHCVTIGVPRGAIAERVGNPESCLMKPIPGTSPALRLLTGYLSLASQGVIKPEEDAVLAQTFTSHVHDLMALALGAVGDAPERAKGGVRAARLQAVKNDVMAHLEQPGLSLAAVAARHGVTPRYVQKLFELEGVTFSEFVLGRRLERAHRMLSNPCFNGRSVADICYETGFADLSYFNRTFRRRFGATPTEIRIAAARDG